METKITLKELSRISGFSVSTVSKAINNKLDISEKTKQLIHSIAKEHNYIPNTYAIGLRKKRTQAVAVIVPQVNTNFYSWFLFNLEKLAYNNGYKIVLYQSFESPEKEKECIKISSDGSVDGVILLSKNKPKISNNNYPLEFIQITEHQSKEQLEKYCIHSFNTLLKNIA
ncbi:LacI family DNA-binding transcriptional regulator [Lacinutrix sp. 5H-3-7-4]|uniref:LacI family DNA-binding transcriptional regulator n=1 Tax=Lacinutrix sp. (strain 5H-3-7-4) TaxID=983544 RepID=UPI00020A3C55|nr:LacI family DNA-binding transcriptional regulator [Lacinutrix sp. 5H-3-7-4]AEH01607.1 transcriptional regulator, LacI family [Lacinutrix sp. 5H-3-7-4]